MPKTNRSQIRINVLLRMMKEKKYPNYTSFLKEMQSADIAGAYNISSKTLQRDIKFLKKEFKAPIEYDYEKKGYYLNNLYWDNVPLLEEVETDAAVLGAQLAGGILPNIKANKNIRTATDAIWSKNCGEHDNTMVISALMATGAGTKINPDFFQTIFEAWQKRNYLQMQYKRANDGYILDMLVAPHILVFHENNWYLRAKLLKTGEYSNEQQPFLTFALQRVQGVVKRGGSFEICTKEVKKIQENGIFGDMKKVENVKLHLRNSGLHALEYLTPSTEEKLADGSIIITLAPIHEYRVLNLVLTGSGNVTILTPQFLKEKALSKAKDFITQQEKNI